MMSIQLIYLNLGIIINNKVGNKMELISKFFNLLKKIFSNGINIKYKNSSRNRIVKQKIKGSGNIQVNGNLNYSDNKKND